MTTQRAPWAIDMKRNLSSWAIMAGKKVIAACKFQEGDRQAQLENAQFIVRACNAHDDLVEIAQAVLTWDFRNNPIHFRKMAEEALAKAKA